MEVPYCEIDAIADEPYFSCRTKDDVDALMRQKQLMLADSPHSTNQALLEAPPPYHELVRTLLVHLGAESRKQELILLFVRRYLIPLSLLTRKLAHRPLQHPLPRSLDEFVTPMNHDLDSLLANRPSLLRLPNPFRTRLSISKLSLPSVSLLEIHSPI